MASNGNKFREDNTSWATCYSIVNLRDNIKLSFFYNEIAGSTNEDGSKYLPVNKGTVEYNLAAYINSMITSNTDGSNTDFIEAAKALYAFSYAAEQYKAK